MPAFSGIGTGRSPALPANIQVRYQGRRCNGLVSDTIPQWYLSTIPLSMLTFPIPLVTNGNPVGRGTACLKDTAEALFHVGVADPTNKTTLDSLAKQIAQDIINWQNIEFDQTYNGILNITPSGNGITDLIEWSMTTEMVQTRIITQPYCSNPEEFQHNDPANATCIDVTGTGGYTVSQAPCIAYYGPLATCVSGSLHLPRFKLCLEDGRLFSTFTKIDIITASG